MGRPSDPTRRRRKTGNRPMPGDAKASTEVIPIGVVTGDPDAIPSALDPPEDLPEPVQEIWRRAVAELYPRGLREADLEAIRMMCIAAYRHQEAAAKIDEYGILVTGQRGPMVNPLLKVEKDMAATYLRIAEAYGLTIAARMRLGLMQLAGQSMLQSLNADLDMDV